MLQVSDMKPFSGHSCVIRAGRCFLGVKGPTGEFITGMFTNQRLTGSFPSATSSASSTHQWWDRCGSLFLRCNKLPRGGRQHQWSCRQEAPPPPSCDTPHAGSLDRHRSFFCSCAKKKCTYQSKTDKEKKSYFQVWSGQKDYRLAVKMDAAGNVLAEEVLLMSLVLSLLDLLSLVL